MRASLCYYRGRTRPVFASSLPVFHHFVTLGAARPLAGRVRLRCAAGGPDAAGVGGQAVRAAPALGSAVREPRRAPWAAHQARGAQRQRQVHVAPGRRRGVAAVGGTGDRAAAHRVRARAVPHPAVFLAGLATAVVCLFVGAAAGTLCNPPLLRHPGAAALATLAVVIVALAANVSPAGRCPAGSTIGAEDFVEPVEHALFEEGAGHRLAVHVGSLGLGERHELLGAGQGVVEAP